MAWFLACFACPMMVFMMVVDRNLSLEIVAIHPVSGKSCTGVPPFREQAMQSLHVNGYDMAYLEVGEGPPLVCVHGTLGDFRTWHAVLGPLSKRRRVIAVSLRHFFPEHWDGAGGDYRMAQHVADV